MVPRYFYGETTEVFPGIVARNKAFHNYEKFIHRTIYPRIIHPHSLFRVYWEVALIILTLFELVFFFFAWAFLRHDDLVFQCLLTTLLAIHLIDCVLMFFTGYVEGGTEIVVLRPRRIIRRYLLSTFILDLLSSLPIELLLYFFKRNYIACSAQGLSRITHAYIYLSAIQILLRIPTSIRYLRNTSRVFFWNPFTFSIISLSVYVLLIVNSHFIIIISLKFPNYPVHSQSSPWSDFSQILSFIFKLIHLFFKDCTVYTGWYYLIRIPTLLLSFCFKMYLFGYIIMYVGFKIKTTERFYFLQSSVRIFAKNNRLPFSLKQKTLLYFQVYIQSKHYKEDEMFNYFPEAFKSEIFSHLTLPLLKAFYAFEGLPIYVLRRLAECLRYQLYLPTEMVMTKGETKLNLYFVNTGAVALYSKKGVELYHFEDGSCFNGKQFLDGKFTDNNYAISLEVTEIYRLEHDDFINIMDAYPKLLGKMKHMYCDVQSSLVD